MYKYLLLALLFIGCSTKPIIIEREVPILIPAIADTITLQDTIINVDTLWFGNVNDSLGNVIGELKVYYQRKIAELRLNKRIDTVIVRDSVIVENKGQEKSFIAILGLFNWWEKGSIILLLALLIFFKFKRV